ncbi:putative enzymatic polyprotein [Sesamum angolense]|uniref:Enzymatic polyprotein n=1 Tax=Sesamum angolense TaxID=2727404 RepID=A0AAE1X9J7_9LAMI|nr:putative enzymatic polyprotein [Sesamum angolense]
MTVSNKTMERIMRQDSNLSPYDGFRIGGIGKVLNQIGLNQRKHHIIYKVSSGEFAIPIEFTGNVMEMQLIPKEEILEEISRLREEVAVTMKWIHIGTIEVVIKATFKEGIDSEIHLSIMDRRINNLRDGCLGTMIGNLYAGKLMFDIHPRIAYNLADQDFSRVLTLHQDFKRKDLMKEGNRPYSITYRIAYAISNTHHSDLFLRKEYIEIPRIFKEFAKVIAPDPIRIPRIGGVDIVIKDHPVLDRTMSSRIEYGSRMSFSEDRITGYKGKEKDLARVLTPQEIRQPVIGRYEGMLEIAGHEFLVAGVAGRENGCMTLGLSFLEDHKPWGRKEYFAAYIDSGSGICTAKPGVFPKEARETLPVIAGRDFSQKILILNTGIREAKIMIRGAFGTPWFKVLRREKAFNRIMPINFRSNCGDFDAKLTNPKMQDKRKFGKVLLSFRQQGLIETDSFHEESEEELKNLKERNFSENPLAWWDRNKIEATLKIKEECKYEYVRYKPMNMEDKKDMQIIIKEHISLGLIEPGISAYSSPGFLIKMESESKKFTAFSTPQGQYIWNVLPMGLANAPQIFQRKMDNLFKDYFEFMFVYIDDILIASKNMKDHIKHLEIFSDACHKEGLVLSEKKANIAVNKIEFLGILIDEAGIFIKDLAKYRKDFRPLLKETESAKWKWEEIHTQRVRELKQVCNNLPKLAIPQDEDELVVYTDANDYRWAAVLMKKTTTGEEPCRYTGGLFTEQQAQVWHINEKEFFAVWKAFKKWPLFLLAKEFTLKVDNTNVKAFLKNKLESKIEKAQMEGAEANSVMLRLRHLRENLEELDREFGRLAVNAQVAGQVQRADLDKVQTNIRSSLVASTALWNALLEPIRKASPSVMTRELREQGSKPALRVQGSKPVAADSSTACTRLSSDSGEKATDESQGVKTSDDSSQPSTSGVKEGEISLRPMTGTSKTNTNELSSSSSSAWQVYQMMWEKLISRKGVNPSKTIIETTGKYNRVWMMEGSKPEEVREWYEFGPLASVHTMSPSFPKISKLPEWISGAVYDSWQNNPHLKRGDILELKFISTAPEMAGQGSHPAFHFIKLQRPDMVAFNRIKATTGEAPLVSAISEDDISTRRAWGLWVCLTEMDKVKYPFKIFSNKMNGSFLLNSMTGKSTEFAESMFEKKRMLIWENKLSATESTRMKACNILHVGQWHNHVCPCCEKQKKPLFGTKIRVTQKKPEPNLDKAGKEDDGSNDVIQMTNARTSSKQVEVRI